MHFHAHYRQTNQSVYNLKKNQTKHIFIFIQELCILKTITFDNSSLLIKKDIVQTSKDWCDLTWSW